MDTEISSEAVITLPSVQEIRLRVLKTLLSRMTIRFLETKISHTEEKTLWWGISIPPRETRIL